MCLKKNDFSSLLMPHPQLPLPKFLVIIQNWKLILCKICFKKFSLFFFFSVKKKFVHIKKETSF